MTTIGIMGKPRTGKTVFLTSIGYFDYLNGRKIWSNYSVNYPHNRYSIEELLSIQNMEMEISPKTVLLQEASKWFDARRSGRSENVLLSSFTGQSGKRDIDIYYDDQFMTRIDRGLRDITDYTYLTNLIKDKDGNPLLFEYEMFRGYFLYPLGKRLLIPAMAMSQFYTMYNTREPTKALQSL